MKNGQDKGRSDTAKGERKKEGRTSSILTNTWRESRFFRILILLLFVCTKNLIQ